MMQFENKVVVKRPLEEVFEFMSHFENVPKWNYFVVGVQKVSEDSARRGNNLPSDS